MHSYKIHFNKFTNNKIFILHYYDYYTIFCYNLIKCAIKHTIKKEMCIFRRETYALFLYLSSSFKFSFVLQVSSLLFLLLTAHDYGCLWLQITQFLLCLNISYEHVYFKKIMLNVLLHLSHIVFWFLIVSTAQYYCIVIFLYFKAKITSFYSVLHFIFSSSTTYQLFILLLCAHGLASHPNHLPANFFLLFLYVSFICIYICVCRIVPLVRTISNDPLVCYVIFYIWMGFRATTN